jgi:hypothetical protein
MAPVNLVLKPTQSLSVALTVRLEKAIISLFTVNTEKENRFHSKTQL